MNPTNETETTTIKSTRSFWLPRPSKRQTIIASIAAFALLILVLGLGFNFNPIRPRIPVGLSFRDAVGPGKVLTITNNTNHDLPCVVVANCGSQTDQKEFRISVPARSYKNLGWAQGWTFDSARTGRIDSLGYNPAFFVEPKNIPFGGLASN